MLVAINLRVLCMLHSLNVAKQSTNKRVSIFVKNVNVFDNSFCPCGDIVLIFIILANFTIRKQCTNSKVKTFFDFDFFEFQNQATKVYKNR